MIETAEWLRAFIFFHPSLIYLVIFLGVAFGGELFIFALAFLVTRHIVPVVPFVALTFLATLLSNILWFFLGKTSPVAKIISHRYANGTITTMIEAITRISKGNHFLALTFIKFIVGTCFILIIYTHKTGLKWKQFIYGELVAIVISLSIIIPTGLLSGFGFFYLAEASHNIYAAIGYVLIILILVIMAQIWFKKIFIKKS